jgi:hypothetical protein
MGGIGVAERRARLGLRHHLAPAARAADPVTVAADLVGLHATDPSTVHLAAAARLADPEVAAVERALYDERSLVRMLGMRRTMFVEPDHLAPVVHAACTLAIGANLRRQLVAHIEQLGLAPDGEAWLGAVEAATLEVLGAKGEALAAELSAEVEGLRAKLVFPGEQPWAGPQPIGYRVLNVLAAQGRIVRGRPRGSWVSSQYRWSLIERWLPGGLAELPLEAAQADLARAWLGTFGPATVADLKWWTGWTMAATRRALAAVGAVEVDLDGAAGVVLPGDDEPSADPGPWVALLPALDPTTMGWKERAWYLGEHGPALFDRNGNAGPTIWAGGRVVGGWGQRKDGEIALRLLEDVGAEAGAAIEAQAARLAAWYGDVRTTPRFRTPVERELTA